jgi:N utilization substance protein A
VVQELRGEKIDIVPYSEDPATFVCNALQPAEVSRVLIDEANHKMEIIVPDDQLSLAIGRKGQNVRLASQLSGWRLDIHSESRIGEIRDRAWKSLTKIDGINEFLIQTLYNHGIRSARDFMESDRTFLEQFPGMTEEVLQKLLVSAGAVAEVEKKEEEQNKLDQQRATQAADWARKLQELMKLDDLGRLRLVRGTGEASLDQLIKSGFTTVESIAEAEIMELSAKAGINDKKAKQLKYSANQRLKHEREIRDEAKASGVTVNDGVVQLPGHDVDAAVASNAMGNKSPTTRAEA